MAQPRPARPHAPSCAPKPTGEHRAFTIDDLWLALRWASLARRHGYALSISQHYANADEVLEIRVPPLRTPVARVYRGASAVWVSDCVGISRPYPTLAEALDPVWPMSRRDLQLLLRPERPPSVWTARRTPAQPDGGWRRFVRLATGWMAGAGRRGAASGEAREGRPTDA